MGRVDDGGDAITAGEPSAGRADISTEIETDIENRMAESDADRTADRTTE